MIKNIIFDLGGVLLNIDFQRTYQAFEKLGAIEFPAIYSKNKQTSLFDDFEIGKISADIFRHVLKEELKLKISNEEFDDAWNALLLDLPKSRLDFIEHIKKTHRVFLFSNTNEIHLKAFFRICQQEYGMNSLARYFDKEYYSCRFGKRKPDPDAFKIIVSENNIKPSETLFIDDTLQHVQGAQQAELQAIHLTQDKTIFDVIER
ncbi:MAG: hypothetical protein A3F42_01000 [Gammaproteobacteria bacterium RIFCSPHIGHO2_12_FULL_37_34]|nr:MAG: hypothetical protein A3F42_01000 [Gammaproteobacteria bacterium RIFCSPHIGHO2_12_FULL_37_34]